MPNAEVESDHRNNSKKALHQDPPRLQKMIMTTQKYSLHVTYHPSKQLVLADTLSRVYLSEYRELIEEKFVINIPTNPANLQYKATYTN